MSRNRVLGKIFASKREDVTEAGENCVMRSYIIVLFTKHDCDDQPKEGEK